ncbi:hypothetical protein HMPREF0506_2083 [Lactobacillus crispatus JV-V01]|nr:hypothetical protein HMPREF0506_2083 [Lactobacillus crispatus JV-V01]
MKLVIFFVGYYAKNDYLISTQVLGFEWLCYSRIIDHVLLK